MTIRRLLRGLFPTLIMAALLAVPVRAVPVLAAGADLWVDAKAGSDANPGTSSTSAFRTIQAAAKVAAAGATVHILPGVYRESVVPAQDGSATAQITYVADSGPGTVVVRGSEPASSLTWTRLSSNTIGLPAGVNPANIYYADLSSWKLAQPPRFVVQLDSSGNVTSRLYPAREPDWQVTSWWKTTEFWWLANGGSAVAACNPATSSNKQCDAPSRSYTQLTDTTTDTAPSGVEPGNLTTLGSLVGATLVAMDDQHAHYIYHGTITAHDVAAGRITVGQKFDNDGSPGLGWGSKYYVENHPALLDQPGEWWFDVKSGRLYLWSPNGASPATLNMEISRRSNGFDLTGRSYITLNGLTVEFFNDRAYTISNGYAVSKAFGDVVRNSTFRYANQGLVLYQYMNSQTPSTYAISNFLLENSDIGYMDTVGIDASYWWPNAPSPAYFNHSGVRNVVIRNNNLHDLGFDSDARMAVGNRFMFPDKMRFVGNTVARTAHSGVHFLWSLISSTKQYGFSPSEIKIGNVLVSGNLFDRTCMQGSDCGALKFAGSQRPITHVFRDALITGNVFRNGIGWSYVSILRGKNTVGDANGFYLDNAAGVHVYRNIAYNNTGAGFKLSCLWRDGDSIFYNNIAANNYAFGFKLTGAGSCDNHNGSVDTQIVNNVLVNNDAYGMQVTSAYDAGNFGNLVIDHNLYYKDGWNSQAGYGNPADIQLFEGSKSGQYFHTLSEIRSGTLWEDHGVEGDPAFASYDPADHNRFDNSWPDFHLTSASTNAIDRGTAGLPTSLSALLTAFSIADPQSGSAFDIGRYELISTTPAFNAAPASWNYGVVRTGTTAPEKAMTVKNTGGANLNIGAVSLQGTNADQFHVTADTCSGATVAPGASCSVSVTFAPTSTGGKSASLSVPDNAAGSPHQVALSGKGGTELALNGGFNTYPTTTAMVPANWTAVSFTPTDGKSTTTKQEGTASVKIANTSAVTKSLAQGRAVTSGMAGETLQVSAWVSGQSIPTTAGLVRVQVQVYNGTALLQTQVLDFPAGSYAFRQKKATFATTGAYTRVVIRLIYSKGSGTAWFDGLSLLRSP